MFTTPYSRPQRLSPGDSNRPEDLSRRTAILQKPDTLLNEDDYTDLFWLFSPAGSYEELVYFLPFAIAFMGGAPAHSLQVVSSTVAFIENNIDRLRADMLESACVCSIRDVFQRWTQVFAIDHYEGDQLKKLGYVAPYADHVRNSDEVVKVVTSLATSNALNQVAHGCLDTLNAEPLAPARSAWYLEIAHRLTKVPWRVEEVSIAHRLADRQVARRHLTIVAGDLAIIQKHKTYWTQMCDYWAR
jgi:hypothetical protein